MIFLKPASHFFFSCLLILLYLFLDFLVLIQQVSGEHFTPTLNPHMQGIFALWSIAALIIYILAFSKAREHRNTRCIIGLGIILYIILFVVAPFGSLDIFNYIYRARIFTVYGENPYFIAPASFPFDVMDTFVGSRFAKSLPIIYGPAWAIVTFIPSSIFRNNIFLVFLSIKFIVLIFHFANARLIYRIINIIRPEAAIYSLMLYLWNPLIVFEFANNAHNDAMLLFFLLLAVFFLVKRRFILVLPALILSVLVKYQTAILLPFFIVALWKTMPAEKIKTLIYSFGVSVIFIIVSIFPFSFNFDIFRPIESLARTISTYYNFTVLPFVLKFFLGPQDHFIALLSLTIFAITYCFLFLLSLRICDNFFNFFKICFWLYVALYICGYWIMPWYFVFPITFGILIPEKKYRALVYFFVLMAFSSYFITYILFLVFVPSVIMAVFFVKKNIYDKYIASQSFG